MKKFQVKRSVSKSTPDFVNPDARAFVIGNGTTRKNFDLRPLMNHGILVGCNYFYRDMHPHVLVLSDEGITETVAKVDKEYCRRNHVFSWYPKPGGRIKKVSFPEKTSAGLMAVYESIVTFGCKEIFLIGMDFFGLGSNGKEQNGIINNLYVGKKHYAQDPTQVAPTYRNWQRRFQWVMQQFPDVQFYHVAPLEDKSPERLIGAPNWHQVSWENLNTHLNTQEPLVDFKSVDEDAVELFKAENPDNIRATLERQFTGQENYIYPDKIDPRSVLSIKLQAQEAYRKSGNISGMISVRIKEFDVGVPPTIINTPNGSMLADDKMIVELYKKEVDERCGKMGIKLEPYRSIEPKGVEEKLAPPPPPSFDDLLPPPPPSF